MELPIELSVENDDLNIKVLKLNTGEQIITNIFDEDETSYYIQRPMLVESSMTYKSNSTHRLEHLFLTEWLRFCDLSESTPLSKSKVLLELVPMASLVVLYKKEIEIQDNPIFNIMANADMPKVTIDDGKGYMSGGNDSPNTDMWSEKGISIQFYIPQDIFRSLLQEGLIDDIKDIIDESMGNSKEDWDDDSSEEGWNEDKEPPSQ